MAFETLITKLKNIDIHDEFQYFFELSEIESLVKDMQQQQLNEGKRGDNSDITPEYTPYTKMLKRAKGQPTDRVTLKDRGNFWNSIKTSPTNEFVEIYATDKKTPALLEKYNDEDKEVLGLNSDNIDILRLKFKEYLIIKLRK